MVATKVSHDLERVGDEATAIARRARDLNREPQLKAPLELPRMASMVTDMLAESLDAFITGDCARRAAPFSNLSQPTMKDLAMKPNHTLKLYQHPLSGHSHRVHLALPRCSASGRRPSAPAPASRPAR